MMLTMLSLLIDIANKKVDIPDTQRHMVCIQILDRVKPDTYLTEYHIDGMYDFSIPDLVETSNKIEVELDEIGLNKPVLKALYIDICLDHFQIGE